MGDKFRLARHHIGKALFQNFCYFRMQFSTFPAQQAVMDGVLNEGVFEIVLDGGRGASSEDHFRFDKLGEPAVEFGFGFARDGGQQIVRKLAADYRANLYDFLGRGVEPVDTGEQRCLDRKSVV